MTIEGRLIDMATAEELLYFTDEYIAEKKSEDISMFDEDDRDLWDVAVKQWAEELVRVLKHRRGEQYVFSK